MKVVTAPEIYEKDNNDTSIFLAGGITGCPDWQSEVIAAMKDHSVVLLNPRRQNFPIHNPDAAQKQIEWEHRHLRLADAIAFWFPCETLCPIVLYELGAWSMSFKPLIVATHPDYKRRNDVVIQTMLVRPDVEVTSSLDDIIAKMKLWTVEAKPNATY